MRFLIILLFTFQAYALTDVEKSYIPTVNILTNPGFENGKTGWTASGGSFAVVTNGGGLLEGLTSVTWDSNSAAQTLTSSAVTIKNGMLGKPGVAVCTFVTTGTATHTMTIWNGSNNLVDPITITSNSNPVRTYVPFSIPTGGTIALRITSTASNEPLIGIDGCYLGPAEGVSLLNAKTQDVFSALVSDGSSTTTVSRENADWINGNCTNGSAGTYVCTFNSGIFSTAPNCFVTTYNVERSINVTTTASAATMLIYGNTSGALIDSDFQISCQKAGVDAPAVGYKIDTLASSWSGYHDNTCSWSRTNTSYGAFTADASCALVETVNNNFGTVVTDSSGGNALPGIVFTPKRVGTYYVCAHALDESTASHQTGYQLIETSTSTIIAESQRADANNTQNFSIPLCGLYKATTTSAKTISIYGKQTSGAITLNAIATVQSRSVVEWSVMQVDQAFSVPFITNAVVSGYAGVVGLETASLNCDSASIINSQMGSWVTAISNISAGTCTITIAANVFSSTPYCVGNATADDKITKVSPQNATSVIIGCVNGAGSNCSTADFNIICMGPR